MIRAAIRRPVAVAMLYLAVALLGVAAWAHIPIELLPDAEFPRLTVNAHWPGASPETVEAFVTSPVEAEIQAVRNVREVASTSQESASSIRVELDRQADMDFVRLDLSERLARLEEELRGRLGAPGLRLGVEPYLPDEFEEDALRPLLTYRLTGPLGLEALRAHLEEVVEPELGRMDGVRFVQIRGATRERILEIELEEDDLLALGINRGRVEEVIQGLDLRAEAGAVRREGRDWTLAVRDQPESVEEVRGALVAPGAGGGDGSIRSGQPVRVRDLGRIRESYTDPERLHRIDGSPAVSLLVYRDYGTNAVEVARQVRERVEELQALSPPGTAMVLVDDQSDDIRRHLTDLRTRALFSALVIFLVLLTFLRSLLAAGVVFLTIAFSILIALNLVHFAGSSLNLLTLMGLALGFGLVVDNSIVVLENIHRKWQEGAGAREASERGARDVGPPIVASTLTTVIVFVPFVYFQGELRIYYVPLAMVVVLTLAASLFVAFTFIPALADRILRLSPRGMRPRPASATEVSRAEKRAPFYIRVYAGLLELTLRAPWAAVLVAGLCLFGSWHLFDNHVQRGLRFGGAGMDPTTIRIAITLPDGSDMERADELTRSFERRLAAIPQVERFETMVEGTRSHTVVTFPEELELTPLPLVVEERLQSYALRHTGARIRVVGQGRGFVGGVAGTRPNYRVDVYGYNFDGVREIAEDLGRRLEGVPRVHQVNTNAAGRGFESRTEYVVHVDRDALDRREMTVVDLIRWLRGFVEGAAMPRNVTVAGEPLRYRVRIVGARERQVRDLERATITSPNGGAFRAGEAISVEEREVMPEIRRENQEYHRVVAYEFRGPRALGDLYHAQAIATTVVPPGYRVEPRAWGWSRDEERRMWLVLLGAVALVFMLTSGLFESIRQPFCVLLAVPMALTGVFLAFFWVNATFTREAFIGVIMMGGIVVNNAILLVDHINRVRRERGAPGLREAIVRGTLERVRPILMTTLTTVLGLLPLVLFMPHADATIWNALTYALIGGLLSSTLFVLTTTPALYLLVERGPPAPAGSRETSGTSETGGVASVAPAP